MDKETIEVYIVVDDEGNAESGIDIDDALERFEKKFNLSACLGLRTLRATISLNLPTVIPFAVEVPDEPTDIAISFGSI